MTTKVALVTGAGTGIGQEIATGFARQGATVVAVGRRVERLETTRAQIVEAGGQCVPKSADMGDRNSVAALFSDIDREFGRLDVLVNNAGQVIVSPLADMPLADFDAMQAVNTAGVVYASRAAWPLMKRHDGGVIINISSMAALDPFPGLAVYGATKAFVNLLTKGLAEEGRAHGIAVFAVGPGAVETDMLRGAFPDFPSEQSLRPAAIADLCVALTDPAWQVCTGQVIYARR